MDKFDLSKAKFILSGVSKYDHLPALPSVENNLNGMNRLLRDHVKPEQIIKLFNSDLSGIEAFFRRVELEISQVQYVFFYYSGHGVTSSDLRADYYLSTARTDPSVQESTYLNFNAIKINDLFDLFQKKGKTVVCIIDSCFSGYALDKLTSENSCCYTSVSKVESAQYPPDEEYSVFTGSWIEIIKEGIPGASKYLSFDAIFQQVKENLLKLNKPAPKTNSRNLAGNLAFLPNNYDINESNIDHLADIRRIVNRLYHYDDTIDQIENIKTVLKNYPYFMTLFLKTILIKENEKELPVTYYHDWLCKTLKIVSFTAIAEVKEQHFERASPELQRNINQLKVHNVSYVFLLRILNKITDEFGGKLIMSEINRTNIDWSEFLSIIGKNLKFEQNVDYRRPLLTMVENLAFLSKYQWGVVSSVNVTKIYKNNMYAAHWISHLVGEGSINYKQQIFRNRLLHNVSVFFTKKGDSLDTEKEMYVNLWPFIIDRNSDTKNVNSTSNLATKMPEIYVYKGFNGNAGMYVYDHLVDHGEDFYFNDILVQDKGIDYKLHFEEFFGQ